MRSIRSLGALAALSLAAATAQAALITFDEVPDGTVLSNQYAALGVTFSADLARAPQATTAFCAGECGGLPVSGNILENRNAGNDRARHTTISFAAPTSGISFDYVPFGSLGGNTLVEAFDASDVLLWSSTTGTGCDPCNYPFLVAAAGVSKLVLTNPQDGWVFGLDNLRFESVPEPGTFALAGLALVGLALRRRAA